MPNDYKEEMLKLIERFYEHGGEMQVAQDSPLKPSMDLFAISGVTSGELLEEIVAKESASIMKNSRRKREDIGKGLVHDQYQLRDAKAGKVMQMLRT
uniref:Serine/threonine-protein kinase VPS15-like n=1 Tax=Cicer arietinum TaxID=3827 RepID=A0A3Q7XII3_CICAR|nr:serine/threonine-protein kinase VPS15-like [Cicer arietinum]XP_027186187.1 serine/threonine-protein kinase VPS15-like [Cicer arietinum]XP_027186188.1 serine/threonine-protein kinase VPS15-like [Cicer arietinum]